MAERLLAADRRELDLKEKLHNLQKAEKEMELALQEQKRVNDDLRQELKDQDDLIGKIHNQYWAKMWTFINGQFWNMGAVYKQRQHLRGEEGCQIFNSAYT